MCRLNAVRVGIFGQASELVAGEGESFQQTLTLAAQNQVISQGFVDVGSCKQHSLCVGITPGALVQSET